MKQIAVLLLPFLLSFCQPAFAQNVTPFVCPTVAVAVGGTAVNAVPGRVNGGYIWNLSTNSGTIFVNPAGTATTTEGGGNYPLAPGGSPFYMIPGSSKPLSVNSVAAQSFGCVSW